MSVSTLLNPEILHVSEHGLAMLREQLSSLEARYEDVCEQRRIAHELSGDGWHDNPEFNRQQQMEAFLNTEIKDLLGKIKNAQLFRLAENNRPKDRVWLGSVIEMEVVDEITGDSRMDRWEITGYGESDPKRRCLSYNTPLAKHILTLEEKEWSDEFQLGDQRVSVQICRLFDSRVAAGLKP